VACHRKQAFKLREGFDPATLCIPQRTLETATPMGAIDEGFLRETIQLYAQAV